eukprot:SAG31_NODE_5869_length_2282_cov_1.382501_1_plen_58_part_10
MPWFLHVSIDRPAYNLNIQPSLEILVVLMEKRYAHTTDLYVRMIEFFIPRISHFDLGS